MARSRGMSVRLRLTLSYAAVIIVTGSVLLTVVWLFLLRYVPRGYISIEYQDGSKSVVPDRDDLLRAFIPPTTAMFALLVIVGLVGGWFLAGRMLRPLNRLHDAAQKASEGSFSHRVALDGKGDEFRDLSDVFDRMLDELELHVGEQQRFAANASHELRTPLAITRTLLENAASDPSTKTTELISKLSEVNAREIALVESLLLLAKAENTVARRELVDLSLFAEDAVETLGPLATSRGIRIDTDLHAAEATGDSALLLQMATNLVHNALVHNVPQVGTVTIRTRQRNDHAQLIVENTGEALDESAIATFTAAFQRGQRTTTHGSGVGLGLAIVASIVRAHRGELSLRPRLGGGLTVTVRLPRWA